MNKRKDILIKATKALTQTQVPAGPSQDVLNATCAELAKADETGVIKQIAIIERIQAMKTYAKFAVAAAIILVVIITTNQFDIPIDGASVAFADVLEQISTFRPYVCTQTIQYQRKSPSTKTIMKLNLSQRREMWADGSIYVFDMSERPVRILTLYPDKKYAVEKILAGRGPVKDHDRLRILAGRQDGTEEDLGITEIDGRKVKVFHAPDKINDFTVWADVETGLPVRIELLQKQLKRTIIMEEFEFDVDFDESLFSTTAPQGYTVKKTESKLKAAKVTVEQLVAHATFQTYILAEDPPWTGTVHIIEATDPVTPGHLMYVLAALADDGRHLVLAQSETFNKMLGQKVKQGHIVYTSAGGFKVWAGGPDKWYSKILLDSARDIIQDSPSDERIGYVIESPVGTFIPMAVNGPVTDDQLHSVVDSLIPAKEYQNPNFPSDKQLKPNEDKETKSPGEKEKLLDIALKLSGKKVSTQERNVIMRMLNLNEKDLIKGLGVFVELSEGQYPSKLDTKTTLTETGGLWRVKHAGVPVDDTKDKAKKKAGEEKGYDIFFASAFYDKLIREKKDVAYYGDKITVEDSDKVLMRWKLSKDKYRVVFGNLTRKTVTAEELAELEKLSLE